MTMKIPLSIPSFLNADKSTLQYYVAITTLCVAIITLPFSIKICHAAFILFIVNWLCEGNWREKFLIIKKNILILLIIGLFAIELSSSLFSSAAGASGVEKKIFLFLLPIALATSSVKLTSKDIFAIFYGFVASCFVCSIICIGNALYQINLLEGGFATTANLTYLNSSNFRLLNPDASESWLSLSYVALASGIGIHPTYFSLYLAFAITFLLFQLDENSLRFKLISWFLITYFSFFIVFLSSRIMILSVIIIFGIAIVQSMLRKETRPRAVILSGISIVFGVLLYFNPVSRYRNLQEISGTFLNIQSNNYYKNSAEIRASLWWLGLKSYEHVNPFWGTGTDDVRETMKQASDRYNIKNSLDSYDPHNQFLFTMVGSGMIGLAIFMTLIAYSIYFAAIQHNYLFMAFMVLFSFLCTTESALELQKGIAFFAIFFSLLAFTANPIQLRALKPLPL